MRNMPFNNSNTSYTKYILINILLLNCPLHMRLSFALSALCLQMWLGKKISWPIKIKMNPINYIERIFQKQERNASLYTSMKKK